MSDEPLFCVVCGEECCDHSWESEGPYCQVCGVIPAVGKECCFMKEGGNCTGCVSENVSKQVEILEEIGQAFVDGFTEGVNNSRQR